MKSCVGTSGLELRQDPCAPRFLRLRRSAIRSESCVWVAGCASDHYKEPGKVSLGAFDLAFNSEIKHQSLKRLAQGHGKTGPFPPVEVFQRT